MQKTYLDQLKKFKGGGSFTSLIGETPKEETKEEDTACVAVVLTVPLSFMLTDWVFCLCLVNTMYRALPHPS